MIELGKSVLDSNYDFYFRFLMHQENHRLNFSKRKVWIDKSELNDAFISLKYNGFAYTIKENLEDDKVIIYYCISEEGVAYFNKHMIGNKEAENYYQLKLYNKIYDYYRDYENGSLPEPFVVKKYNSKIKDTPWKKNI